MTDTPDTLNSTNISECPSPASSSASDSDAFNTANARIHFGPLMSPEKKFGPILARRSTLHPGLSQSPLRRSPRLSTPPPRSPSPQPVQRRQDDGTPVIKDMEELMEATDVHASGPGTPDIEQALQDEPPSVLAIRISRAHDNPSPPPSPSTTTALHNIASPTPRLPFRAFHAAQIALDDANQSEASTPPTFYHTSPGLSPPALPTTPHASRSASQPDLISFEAFSTPAAVFRAISPEASTSKLPPSSDNPSVDDLFPRPPSPSRSQKPKDARTGSPQVVPMAVIESSGADDRKGKGKAVAKAFEELREEATVIDSLLLPDVEGLYRGSSRSPLNSREIAGVGEEAAQTPTRRSTRPRRSGMAHHTAIGEDYEMLDATQHPLLGQEFDESERRQSDQDSGQEDGGPDDEKKAERTPKSKPIGSAPLPPVFHRELGSLSPTSTDLLSSLVASPSRQPLPFSLAVPDSATANIVPENPPRHRFPAFSQQSLLRTPQRSTSPIRFASPSRSTAQKSTNARLQPMALEDPNRTPARRIPIAEAVSQGRVSPLKGSRFLASRSRAGLEASQTAFLTIAPTDSPARRVEFSEATTPVAQKKRQGIRFGSPTRGASKERFGSVELPLPGQLGGKIRERSSSVPPSQATKESTAALRPNESGSSTYRPVRLPFPIVSSEKDPPASIPEETQADISMANLAEPRRPAISSPSKSSLKQTNSRIPRTIKPYSRPPAKSSETGKSTIMRRVNPTTEISQPAVVVHKVVPAEAGVGTSSNNAKTEEPTQTFGKSAVTTSTLKRKRIISEKAAPAKPRPVVVLRQVPRVGGSNTASTLKATALPSVTIAKKSPQHIRRVVDKPVDVQLTKQALHSEPVQLGSDDGPPDVQGVDSDTQEAGGQEVPSTDETLPSSPEPQGDMSAPQAEVPPDGVRRTTRVRKPINPTSAADVFGSSDARPLPSRRNANAQTTVRWDRTFSGMSATALKALTTSNTAKNQRYLAAKLETEVIRKEGARPESPVVKIRTISQRQQDEKGKQRKERAERRARRSDDGTGDHSELDGRSDGGSDIESDSDDQSSSPAPRRHRRGPGDEDDYQTPVRKLKRLKLSEDDRDDMRENERRVKWDRGLYTTIYLDEVKLGTRPQPKENIATKGCLAPTAKAAPLDNLGNLPYADSPLAELVEESVVVKRFVYDNDVEPPPEVIVVKNTRIRSKKSKS
ncbi:hypothetical protein FPV67DRAFT_23274 [Lyophyllum atratum]|nr:hypothetical protein FPV67DRAFT_23274 [Lyophyllum atratum]